MLSKDDVRRVLEQLRVGKKDGEARPHKYLMLLSLISLFEQDERRENRFYFKELEPVFASMMQKLYPHYSYYSIALEFPFYHLQSDGIWHLKIKDGKEELYKHYQSKRLTKNRILETVDYGFLSEEIFTAFRTHNIREAFKKEIREWLERNTYAKFGSNGHDMVWERKSLFEYEQSALEKIVASIENQMSARCLNNVYIWESQTNTYFEYDLIVVARSGIYVVELKHWTGNIEVKQYQWRINKTKYRVDPHKNNSFKCKILKGLYQHNFVTYPDVWVESVVVLTNPDANVENANSPEVANQKARHNLTFGSISDFISYLKRKEKNVQVLDDRQVNAVADFLTGLNRPNIQQKEYTVNGYETVEYLSQKPECIELLARPIGIKAKGLHRLRVFRLVQETESERERLRKIALNTLNAVEQIGDNSYIHKVWAMQTDDGDIIEVSEWSETGTLQDLIHELKGGLPKEKALTLCKNIALALKQAHQNNIIHRAVKPENILIKNDIPKLMNFDLSFQLEDNRLTVIPDASKVKDDGYVAPELLFGSDIDESTDFFSLGVIAYQLLTGEKPSKSTRGFVTRGGELSTQNLQKLRKTKVPEHVINGIKGMVVADRAKRVKDIQAVLSVFACEKEQEDKASEDLPVNPRLQPGDRHDMYEIVEFIGEGAETQLYKAKAKIYQGQPVTVVLKVFNHETPLDDRVLKELNIGNQIRSPYVVRYERTPGHWQGKRFFIVMDYVPGETMRQLIERKGRPNRETFNSIARSLMEGVRALHECKGENGAQKTIVHGDIKPENIIITPKEKPVIIDLGIAGTPRVDAFQGTSGYIPPDSIRGTDRDFSPRSDLFALGVTLWEWLFGAKPYENPAIGDKPVIPEDLPEFRDLYPWLEKAVATEPGKGFASIAEMWDGFTKGMPVADEKAQEKAEKADVPSEDAVIEESTEQPKALDNSFVAYLNSLSCASAGNENAIAECQIRDQNFERIHIPNPLTDAIYQMLTDGKNVILTGNAGDGKTTIAVDILKKCSGNTLRKLEARHEVPGKNLVVIKDMSELTEQERVSVLKEAFENKAKKYLIVSNTGTLLDTFSKFKKILNRDFSDLLTALKASEPNDIVDDRFCLLNIGQLDSIKTACKVFERMLEPNNWTGCSQCKLIGECPVSRNVKLLQSNLALVKHRVYLLYKRLYEYGQRLTMRQMTGHLAYAITGGLNCRDVAAMSVIARRKCLCHSGFFNRFFGDDGNKVIPEATKLMPVQVIRDAGFGSTLMPKFERKAWLKEEAFSVLNSEAREVYNLLLECHSPKAIDNLVLRRQIRRLAYFCGKFDGEEQKVFISTFLDSPMLLDYLEIVCGESAPLRSHLRKMCVKVLHILQEHFTGLRLPEESWKEGKDIYITLKPPGNIAATQMILARFRHDDFELVMKPRYQCGNSRGGNKIFILKYKPAPDVYLELDLPFFDYVARRYEGDMTYQLSAYYSNRLEDFKGKLLQVYDRVYSGDTSETLYLLRIRPDRRFEELRLLISKDELEVI